MIRRTSLNLDLDLVAEARDVLQTRGTTDTIHRALEEIVARERRRQLTGWTPDLTLAQLDELRRGRDWFVDSEE